MAEDDDDRQQPQKAAKISLSASMPTEIIEDILVRLPVKSILRFRAVSKQWLSLISHPSFVKLHLARSTRKSLHPSMLIAGYYYTKKQHFLGTAPHNGGPVMVFSTDYVFRTKSELQHLNGLVLFTCNGTPCTNYHPYVLNPSTRKSYKLTTVPTTYDHIYFFGFDYSINKHKILNIRILNRSTAEVTVFSFLNYSWKKIDVEKLPSDIAAEMYWSIYSVCVNSIIHLKFIRQNVILAFDLKTETFSVINFPGKLVWEDDETKQCLMNMNGLLGVLCLSSGKETQIWILQNYENRTWIKETIPLYGPWYSEPCPYPSGTNLEDIVFRECIFSTYSKITLPLHFCDMKTGDVNKVEFTLPFNSNLVFDQVITSYVESMFPREE